MTFPKQSDDSLSALTEDDIVRMMHRSTQAGCANNWTGTSGTLAADVRRLLRERLRLLVELARKENERPIDYER